MKEKPILIVDEFINSIEGEEKKEDAQHLLKMMQRISGEEPYMWAESIIAFGTVPFTYASGEIKRLVSSGICRKKK